MTWRTFEPLPRVSWCRSFGRNHARRVAARHAGRGADRELDVGRGRHHPLAARRHVDRPRLSLERAHALADHAVILALGADRRAARDEDEADLAILRVAARALAGLQPAEVEADIGPAGALRRDVDRAALACRASLGLILRFVMSPPLHAALVARALSHIATSRRKRSAMSSTACVIVDSPGEPCLRRVRENGAADGEAFDDRRIGRDARTPPSARSPAPRGRAATTPRHQGSFACDDALHRRPGARRGLRLELPPVRLDAGGVELGESARGRVVGERAVLGSR